MSFALSFRVQSYGLELPGPAAEYAQRLLALKGMRQWYDEALQETWRDMPHEADIALAGRLYRDLRAKSKVVTPA